LLRGVSFEVAPGAWVGVIGLNGAGKTTLLRAILGLTETSSGSVWITHPNDPPEALRALPALEQAKRVGFVPQRLASTPALTAEEAVAQGLHPHAASWFETPAQRARALACLDTLDITALATRRLDALSGGELQRVLIAAALAQASPILLLDEPTSAIDLAFAPALLGRLDALRRSPTSPLTLVTTTHDLNLAALYCDALLLLHQGQVIAYGPPSEVLRADPLGRAYALHGLHLLRHPQHPNLPQLLPARALASPADDTLAPQRAHSTSQARTPSPSPSQSPKRKQARLLLTLSALLCGVALWTPSIGATSIDTWGALRAGPNATTTDATIFWQLRLPRALLSMLCGGGLAFTGAALQALLRNPLATPYTLGIAGGSSLGAVAALTWISAASSAAWLSPITVSAFAGASLSALLVLGLSRALGGATAHLLLAGIACSMVTSAAVLLLQHIGGPAVIISSSRWLAGGLNGASWRSLQQAAPALLIGVALVLTRARDLNLISLDDHLASTRGVDIERTKNQVLLGASLATAALIAQTGPIGFVGLIVPHALRPFTGDDQRLLLPASLLAGAAFLTTCDALARALLAPQELPVGILTAIIGGPFLIFVIARQRRTHP
jgi:iron complex transport system permease protein